LYLASPGTSFSWTSIVIFTDHPLRVGQGFTSTFTIYFTGGLRAQISFTCFNRKLYGRGLQSFLLCALSIALNVASVPIPSYSMASSLYAVLPIVLTTVHFDGTFIHSLYNSYLLFARNPVSVEAPPSEIRKLLSFQFEVFKVLRLVIFEDFSVECITKSRPAFLGTVAVGVVFSKAMWFGPNGLIFSRFNVLP